MLLSIAYLIAGLALILVGANILTDGSAALARRIGISDLIVGLTVVAFGTSTPELVISVLSAARDTAGLAVGNVVGSNIFNILVIVGITAIVRPISVGRGIMSTEIPLVILSSLLLIVMANGPLLDGAPLSVITRVDGIILLIFFILFMRETLVRSRRRPAPAPEAASGPTAKPAAAAATEMPLAKSLIFIVLGLAGLIIGGDRFVAGASDIARGMGVSDAVIGLTIVAVGTSLPELAASVAAALKGNSDMALGNVIGSNVFNIFLVLGAAATVRPLPLGDVTAVDLGTLMGASLLFWICGWLVGRRTITRGEGVMLTALYVAYMVWLITHAL